VARIIVGGAAGVQRQFVLSATAAGPRMGPPSIDPRMRGAMSGAIPDVILYGREGCHLCEDARAALQGALEDRATRGARPAFLRQRDITTNPEWERAYSATIPVVEIAGRRLELATSPLRLRRFLDEMLDEPLV
jgi:hypothetical protein